MAKRSAGLLLYRRGGGLEVFLVHPGGPYWAAKDLGSWSIPKGEYEPDEPPIDAARREFTEETAFPAPSRLARLGELKQPGGKLITAWAAEGDCDAAKLRSNSCRIEWPPRSKRLIEIPEVDRGAWFPIADAKRHIRSGQAPFLDRLADLLAQQQVQDSGL